MQPDLAVIETFLHRIGTRQRHHLAFIHPDKQGLFGATYELKQVPAMMRDIQLKQKQGFGIYYSLNEGVRVDQQRGFNGKLLADEIVKVHMLGFDIDWITGNSQERLIFERDVLEVILSRDDVTRPNVIVGSGGGLQVLYTFLAPVNVALSRQKIPNPTQAVSDSVARVFRDGITLLYKDIVLELEARLATFIAAGVLKVDQLGNIDRVFRLPGTVNYPTEAKIAKGATVRMACLVHDGGEHSDYLELREIVPARTAPIERKEKVPFVERPNKKWNIFNKALFLCEFIKEHKLVEDNENYTHSLMFPLFGMINSNEITAAQGRELWLLATSTARDPAHGSWVKKWDTRKIANYTGRDIGSIVHFVRKHDCLLPWSSVDEIESVEREAKAFGLECLRNPVKADEDELLNF
jgi:hypothetical protein